MRAGSKGLPSKNGRKLNGKPLMAYTIEQAQQSGLFEHIVVSTDSKEFSDIAKSFGAESWFLRPEKFATDEAAKLPAIRHAFLESENHFGQQFDAAFDLDVTCPLRLTEDITSAYGQFLRDDAEILFSGCPARKNPYFNMVEIVNNRVVNVKELAKPPVRRQDAPDVYEMNAAIYIWKREALLRYDTLFTDTTSLYIMPPERSVDIDSELDWEFVTFMIKKYSKASGE